MTALMTLKMAVLTPTPSATVTIAASGEARMTCPTAKRIGNVATQVLEPRKRALIAMDLFGLIDAAQRAPRGDPRLGVRQAALAIVVLEHREVRRDLARQLAFGACRDAETRRAREQTAQRGHHGFSSIS